MGGADEKRPELEKEEVTLPDGRRLVYYWFETGAPRPPPADAERPPDPPPAPKRSR